MKHNAQKILAWLTLAWLMGAVLIPALPASATAGGILLFTKHTGIAVTPGELINHTVDIINDSNSIQQVSLQVVEQPKGWEATLMAGGWEISRLSVKPRSEESFTLQIKVPLQVEKGSYRFTIRAIDNNGRTATLPILTEVTEQGIFKTELETDQPSMQGSADATFNYRLTLRNRTADEQLYALSADAPRGWSVDFMVQAQRVTSVKAEANTTQGINVTINPPAEIEAGIYTIPVKAQAGLSSAEVELEVNITGTYNMELSTPTGRLNASITAGRDRMVELQLSNTGSKELRDIKLNSSAPVDWEVRFEPKSIASLLPGELATVNAYIKSSDKAIAGDYVVNVRAQTPEATDSVDFRVTVHTSVLWGWMGVLIIGVVGYGIYHLFRRYGRQ
ncbi:MAG: NEW3 domain-containing protein [Bacillota bacterium]